MRRFLLTFLVLFGLSGCEQVKALTAGKETNPVMGEVPPRVNLARGNRDNTGGTVSSPLDGVQHVSAGPLTANRDPSLDLTGSQKIAMVDNTPILASEILDRYKPYLDRVRRETGGNEEILRTVRERFIRKDLPAHIERRLLVNAFRKSLPEKNLKRLDEHINSVFEQRVEQIKQEMKVDTRYEVEQKLASAGTSLAAQRDLFANQQMAKHFFDAKMETKQVFGRPELKQYYLDHMADYRKPARVRWQEIQISYSKHGGKRAALDAVDRALDALRGGRSFGEVAREFSDASTAAQGGQEDWTQIGSLADKKLEASLFQNTIGSVCPVLESDTAYRIVKINERDPERFTPFGDVQDDIKKTLEEQAKAANAKRVLEELHANAVVTTIFDNETASSDAPPVRTAKGPFGDN